MGIGDPVCDLTIAWTFLKQKSRAVFQSNVKVDCDTWIRSQGWALWKAMITLVHLHKKKYKEIRKQKEIINAVLNEW